MYAATSDPTQAFAAVGHGTGGYPASGHPGHPGGSGDTGMTWDLPPQHDPTQALPAQGGPGFGPGPAAGAAEPDPYAELFRPAGGAAPVNPNATQVMAPVEPGMAPMGGSGYDQPAYDQPIDYQTGGGGAYSEPYDRDYAGEQAPRPRSSRTAMIGIGVAAGAVLVIVISLITLGGGSATPAAAPGSSATEVVTPTTPAESSAPASSEPATSSSSPTTTAPSTAAHPPGTLALGVTGNDVKWLQARLKQLRLYNGEISGTFDAATQAAVVAFQNRTHPSDPSGVVGRSTKTALIAAGSKPQLSLLTPGGDKHGRGANPEDVKRLQRALSTALNQNVKATGQFDMDTFSALVQYQAAVGLTPDGIAGDKVWSALQQGRLAG
ncbi:peptidoglycan-binding protein [Catenulispora subtropica]|uniref:Peptidoglycan binding-like domain-containing protein n=1 Tax=Catenulispora subtropica TaxID=450798 RepID=A0ABP5BRW6_9ACTN